MVAPCGTLLVLGIYYFTPRLGVTEDTPDATEDTSSAAHGVRAMIQSKAGEPAVTTKSMCVFLTSSTPRWLAHTARETKTQL